MYMMNNLLPVGTIVSLRFNKGKFMIIGFCTKEGNSGKVYDYSAVVYPTGLYSFDEVVMFNREYIKKVYYMGYQSDEDVAFKAEIEKKINKGGESIG